MNETDHDSDAALEKRLVDLEVKAAYADDLLDRLNHTIFRQQQQIESLARELLALRQQFAASGTPGPGGGTDERPPHY
ncbi:SlyX family protein [Castellaniella hirudinis]|uniref:SlyX family protein n=3 Tax=Castellaniella TaxID=359336 RepID=A0ABV8S4C0_9BURK